MAMTAAVTAAVTGVASTGMNAYGQFQGAKAAKNQARLDQAQSQVQSELANYSADQALLYGKINADMVTKIAGLNTTITGAVADVNLGIISATTDFNTSLIKATTDFNVSSAEGAARLLQAQGDAQALVHNTNAKLSEFQAQDTLEQGNQAERMSRGAYAQVKGQQRAALAANGVALDEGSALRIQADTDYASDVDASTIRANAVKAALGYRIQAANETMSAKMASLNASAQAADKYAEAVSAKISGATALSQAQIEGAVKGLDIKMSSSFQILQTQMDAQIQALNIKNQSETDAWSMRAQALGYQGQAAQAGMQASSIKPGLLAGTSLLAGAADFAGSMSKLYQSGAFTKKSKT